MRPRQRLRRSAAPPLAASDFFNKGNVFQRAQRFDDFAVLFVFLELLAADGEGHRVYAEAGAQISRIHLDIVNPHS